MEVTEPILEIHVKGTSRQVFPTDFLRNLISKLTAGKLEEYNVLKSELDALRELQREPIATLCKRFAESWKKSKPHVPMLLHSADPVWGQASVDQELSALFSHPLLQRLNFIRQLSFAYLVFPSATHSRLSHTLGVCRLVETAMSTVFRKDVIYSRAGSRPIGLRTTDVRKLILTAKAAALVHDVGHAPFGHALDRFIGFLDAGNPHVYPDKYYSKLYLRTLLRDCLPPAVEMGRLAAMLDPDTTELTGWDNFISALIDSPLDLDRMDFLSRDAHMSGLAMGFNCVEALLERMCPFEEDDQIYLAFEHPCSAYVEDLLSSREKMYVNCYEEPRKLAAERVFTRLVESLVARNALAIQDVILTTDDQILSLIAQATVGSRQELELLNALLHNVPYVEVHNVDIDSDDPRVKSWNSIRDKPGMGKRAYVDEPTSWERAIAAAAKLGEEESWQVLAVVPEHKVRKYAEVEALILVRDGAGFTASPVSQVYPEIEDIVNGFRSQRRKFRVFAHSALNATQKDAVRAAARDLFGSD